MGRGKKRRQQTVGLTLGAPAGARVVELASGEDISGLQPDATVDVKNVPLAAPAPRFSPLALAQQLEAAAATRPMVNSFQRNKEEWKKAEREFVNKAAAELHRALKEFAASDEGWREFLKIYSRAPHYSPSNMLWAWAQLARKGVDSEGMILSETGWKALGRKLKPGYRKNFKEPWDETYAAEMLAPMIVPDKAGTEAARAQNADAKSRTKVIGFRSFEVYHEDATEPTDPDSPKELPKPSWYQATGSEEDAQKLWADVEELTDRAGITLDVRPRNLGDTNNPARDLSIADYDRDSKTLTVHAGSSTADKAAAAIGGLCDHYGPDTPAKDDNQVKERVLARESAKYALCSLYGLASDGQSFNFLSDVAGGEEKAIKRVSEDVHKRVSAILQQLDPVVTMKARGEAEIKSDFESRRSKRGTQRVRASALAAPAK
jgi:hypothetical protein